MQNLKESSLGKSSRVSVSFPDIFHGFPLVKTPAFGVVYSALKAWYERFPEQFNESFLNDILVFFSLFDPHKIDHHTTLHLFRLLLSIDWIQKQLFRSLTNNAGKRTVLIRLLPSKVVYPFSSKPVLGCVVGITLKDRYEVFEDDYLFLMVQRLFPHTELVKEMSYVHPFRSSPLIKLLYLELGKKEGSSFSLQERKTIFEALHKKLLGELSRFVPPVFMRRNQEEVYKNILTLSQQVSTTVDLPQVIISFDSQTPDHVVFLVTLVYVSKNKTISLQPIFEKLNPAMKIVSEQFYTVAYLQKEYPVTAHLFQCHIPRDNSILRSDGSVNFYLARAYVSTLLQLAIGEFRDYNGGVILKQGEHLAHLKEVFADLNRINPELLEDFFYSIAPLEKQSSLPRILLERYFALFLKGVSFQPTRVGDYFFECEECQSYMLISIRVVHTSTASLLSAFQSPHVQKAFFAWSILEVQQGLSLCAILQHPFSEEVITSLQTSLKIWQEQLQERKVLRVALEKPFSSLDPRMGGDECASTIARLLFEGLTSINAANEVNMAVAESVDISADGRRYLFKLKKTFWNDGSPLVAYDFEYAWKSILNPAFPPSFAYLLYPIKNAQGAKEGKVSLEEVGIKALGEEYLQIDLEHPFSIFLKWIASPLFSPVHHRTDQISPKWAHQSGLHFPCNGPFQLEVNHSTEGYLLVKNPFYRNASSTGLMQIILTRMNMHDAHRLFHRDEIDWVGYPFTGWDSSFSPKEEGEIVTFFEDGSCWFFFNTSVSPWNHSKVRRALSLALDRSQLSLLSPYPTEPALSPLLKKYSQAQIEGGVRGNLAKARLLLKEALAELKLENLPVLHCIYPLKGERERIAQFLKTSWKQLGVDFEYQATEFGHVINRIREGTFDSIMMGWYARTDDPLYTLNVFRYPFSTINFARWQHRFYQEILNKADREIKDDKRKKYLAQAEQFLCQECPVIPLIHTPWLSLVRKGVTEKIAQVGNGLICSIDTPKNRR